MKRNIIFTICIVSFLLVGLCFSLKLATPARPIVHCNHPNRAYAFDVIDDSIAVYTEDDKLVGIVKIEGQLDSLIIADNE